MPWQYRICPRTLHFKEPAGTSRGVYTTRDVWYIVLFNRTKRCFGVGECAPLPDLSCDAGPDYEKRLDEVCQTFVKSGDIHSVPEDCPSMRFGLETALLHARAESVRFFRTPFSRGSEDLAINGLVWMGDRDTMKARIETKLAQGFRCIKCKIGGIDFESELELLASIRERFPDPAELELRLDANGAFSVEEAPARLEALEPPSRAVRRRCCCWPHTGRLLSGGWRIAQLSRPRRAGQGPGLDSRAGMRYIERRHPV